MALPPLLDRKRDRGLATVAALTLLQGTAAGAAAFATRGLFEALHEGVALPVDGLAILAFAGAVIAVTRVASRHAAERIGQAYARQIRAALFEHAARMPASAVAKQRAGYMSLRFVGDMTAFRNWLGLGLPRLIAGAVMIPATLTVLWLLDPVFAFVVLPIVLVTATVITVWGTRLVGLQRRLRARRARIAAEMAERMPLAPHLDRLGRRGTELALLEKRTDAMIGVALRHRLAAETLKALPDLAAGIAAALVIFAGYRAGIGTGGIAGALAALGLLVSPLRDLGGVWNHHAAFRAAAMKAEAAMVRPPRALYQSGLSLPKEAVAVVFDKVLLPSGDLLNCQLPPGTAADLTVNELDIQAVGDILLGLDTPASGRILLSGVDLRDLSRGSLRRGVQLIGANPEILQGSLRRVLVMGLACGQRPGDAVLEEFVRDEGLLPLLERLGGLNGTVREGGKNLTRGERIAISLIRVRLMRPRLILLDPDVDERTQTRLDIHLRKRGATVIRLRTKHRGLASVA